MGQQIPADILAQRELESLQPHRRYEGRTDYVSSGIGGGLILRDDGVLYDREGNPVDTLYANEDTTKYLNKDGYGSYPEASVFDFFFGTAAKAMRGDDYTHNQLMAEHNSRMLFQGGSAVALGAPVVGALATEGGLAAYFWAMEKPVEAILLSELGAGVGVGFGGGDVPSVGTAPAKVVKMAGEVVEGVTFETVSVFRKMASVEAEKTLETLKLQPPIPGKDSSKYLSESLEKVQEFQNAKVPQGTKEDIIEFVLDKKAYEKMMSTAVEQYGSKGVDAIKYHYEGLDPNAVPNLRNIGVPKSWLDEFNRITLEIKKSGEQ